MQNSSRQNYKHVIIHRTDTLSDILYSIHQTEGKRILVYLPQNMDILAHSVNVRILKQELASERKNVMFYTSNPEVGRTLREYGFSVDISSEGEEMSDGSSQSSEDPLAAFFEQRSPQERQEQHSQPEEPAQVTSYAKNTHKKPWYAHFGAIAGGILGGVAIAVAAVIFYVPHATVTVSFGGEQLKEEFKVTFDPGQDEVDEKNLRIPATVRSKSGTVSKTLESTGKSDQSQNTKLRIAVKNEKTSEQQLVERTRFKNSQGHIYRTVKGVSIPAGGKTEVTVVADRPGYEYTMSKNKRLDIVNLSTDRVYGTTREVVQKGSQKGAVFVSGTDVKDTKKKLKAKLSEKLANQVRDEVNKEKAVDILSSAQVFNNVSYRNMPAPGEKTETFRPTLEADIAMVLYDNKQLLSLLKAQVSSQLPEDQRLVDKVSLSFSKPLGDNTKLEDGVTVRVFMDYLTHASLNKDKIRSDLTTKSFSEVRSYMQKFSNAQEVSVELAPKIWPRMPFFKRNISVQTKGV